MTGGRTSDAGAASGLPDHHAPRGGAGQSCPACGAAQRGAAAFCDACGAQLRSRPEALVQHLGAQPSVAGEVKQVTVMFVDIVGSMHLSSQLGADAWRTLLEKFFRLASVAVHEVEGTVDRFTGDGIMAIFGAPIGQEDHAHRACLAALRLHASLRPFEAELSVRGVELRTRVGLNSGEVVVGGLGDDDSMIYTVIGYTVAVAARLEAVAPPGSTAVSRSTEALVRGQFELPVLHEALELKGIGDPQRVFELRGRGSSRTRVDVQGLRGELLGFVAREQQQAAVVAALERTAAGVGSVVGVKGEPGVGKSRLVRELVLHFHREGLVVLEARAESHGRRTPLLPVLALLRALFDLQPTDDAPSARARVEAALRELDPDVVSELPLLWDLLGIGDAEHPAPQMNPEARSRRIVDLVSQIIRLNSRRTVLVVVLEDVHWLDDASRAFLDELVSALTGERVLLLLTYRPDYVPSPGLDELVLEPLPPAAMTQLVTQALGDDASIREVSASLVERSGGNPLFFEELVQGLVDTGELEGSPGHRVLTSPGNCLTLPPTVQSTITARLDSLTPEAKDLLLVMSVIGESTDWRLLDAVRTSGGPGLVDPLHELTQANLLVEHLVDDSLEYVFRHPLIQEVAYRAQRSGRRAEAHARVATALQDLHADRLDERAALLAHHLELAGNWADAAQWQAAAASWVSSTSPQAAMDHWLQARRLADALPAEQDVLRLALWSRLGILSQAWRLQISHEVVDQTHREASALVTDADEDGLVTVLLDYAYSANLGFGGRLAEGLEVARANSQRALRLGDPGLIVLTAGAQWYGALTCGYLREGLDASTRALELAGDDTRTGDVLAGALDHPYALCLLGRGYCAGFMGQTSAAVRDISRSVNLARDEGNGEVEALALSSLAFVQSMVGWTEQALDSARASLQSAERRGNAMGLMCAWLALIWAGTAQGDRALVERASRTLLEIGERHGVGVELMTFAHSGLSWVAWASGDAVEAEAAARRAISSARTSTPTWGEVVARARMGLALLASDPPRAADELDIAQRLAAEYQIVICDPLLQRAYARLADQRGDHEEAHRQRRDADRIEQQLQLA